MLEWHGLYLGLQQLLDTLHLLNEESQQTKGKKVLIVPQKSFSTLNYFDAGAESNNNNK